MSNNEANDAGETSVFAARFGLSPTEAARNNASRQSALQSKALLLPEGSAERAIADEARLNDPSARGARAVLRRDDLDRARRAFGD